MAIITKAQSEMQQASRWNEALALLAAAREKARTVGDDDGESMAAFDMGLVYASTAKLDQGLTCLNQATTLAKKAADKKYELTILLATGGLYSNLGQQQEAISRLNQALRIAVELSDQQNRVLVLTGIGAANAKIGKPLEALDAYKGAISIMRSLPSLVGLSTTLNNTGDLYRTSGLPEQALHYLWQALELARDEKNLPIEADALNNIGQAYADIGRPQFALYYFGRALSLETALHNQAREAATRCNIGSVYLTVGQSERALSYYQKALNLNRAVGNATAEATTLSNIGVLYAGKGQPYQALENYQQALLIQRRLNDRVGQAVTLTVMGNVCPLPSGAKEALKLYRQALEIDKQTDNRQDEAYTDICIGSTYYSLHQNKQVIDYGRQALALMTADKNAFRQAATLNLMCVCYAGEGLRDRVLEVGNKALLLEKSTGNTEEEALTQYCIGCAYGDKRYIRKKLSHLKAALALYRSANNKAGESGVMQRIADTCFLLGRRRESLKWYQRALPLNEEFYNYLPDPTKIGIYQDEFRTFYGRFAQELLRLGRNGDAFAMAERGRNKGLGQMAAQARVPLSALLGADAPEWHDINHVHNAENVALIAQERLLDNARDSGDRTEAQFFSTQADTLKGKRIQTELRRDRLQARLAGLHPAFARTLMLNTVSFDTLSRELLNPYEDDKMYVEYAGVDDTTILMFTLSRRTGPRYSKIVIDRKLLMDQIAAWRNSISHTEPDEPQRAKHLFNLLLGKLDKLGVFNGHHYRSLVVVADGELLDVPFAALMDGTGKRLIERLAVSTPVSLTSLTWPRSRRTVSFRVLAVANLAGIGGRPSPVEVQAGELAEQFKPGVSLVGADATKAAVLQQIGLCQILHFGVHSEANAQNGLYSRLMLTGDSEADQALTAAEITEHPLAAELAVLASCDSVRGEESSGEGLIGLAWAFQAAGCPAVVASQWKVAEGATASLMRRLYCQLCKGDRKDVALQKAMLGVMHEPGYETPYYWAAFQIMGNTDPLTISPTIQKH